MDKKRIIFNIASLLCVIGVYGCATPTTTTNPDVFYKRDIAMWVNGVEYDGVGVPAKSDSYKIKVETKHDIDFFTATSCHRQITKEDVGKEHWWFGTQPASYTFTYVPDVGIEDLEPCPLELTGSAQNNEHSWGFLDFESPDTTMPATVYCDGNTTKAGGTSICQSKAGLVQKIQFSQPMLASPDPLCPMDPSKDGMNWEYKTNPGRCVYEFGSKSGFHRHITIGYDQVFVRNQK